MAKTSDQTAYPPVKITEEDTFLFNKKSDGYKEKTSLVKYLKEALNCYSNKITVSSAELLNLHLAYKELIPAPGTGKYINVKKINIKYNFGTLAYDASGGIWTVYYHTSPSTLTSISSADIEATADWFKNKELAGSIKENQPLNLKTIAPPLKGDGTLDIYITYSIDEV